MSSEIEKVLDGMLSELKLNYVDEKGKPEQKEEVKKEKESKAKTKKKKGGK